MKLLNIFLLALLTSEAFVFGRYPESDIYQYYTVTRGIEYAQHSYYFLIGIFIVTVIVIIAVNARNFDDTDNSLA